MAESSRYVQYIYSRPSSRSRWPRLNPAAVALVNMSTINEWLPASISIPPMANRQVLREKKENRKAALPGRMQGPVA